METFLIISLAISLLVVLGILFIGLIAFVKGGEFHQKHGNRLMQMRVTAQAVAVVLVLILVLVRMDGS